MDSFILGVPFSSWAIHTAVDAITLYTAVLGSRSRVGISSPNTWLCFSSVHCGTERCDSQLIGLSLIVCAICTKTWFNPHNRYWIYRLIASLFIEIPVHSALSVASNKKGRSQADLVSGAHNQLDGLLLREINSLFGLRIAPGVCRSRGWFEFAEFSILTQIYDPLYAVCYGLSVHL